MSDHQEVEAKYREQMATLARMIDEFFNGDVRPRTVGFALLIFDFGNASGKRMNYLSNGERADMLTAMKEFIARAEGRLQETETKQ